jgi:hypothetical protein
MRYGYRTDSTENNEGRRYFGVRNCNAIVDILSSKDELHFPDFLGVVLQTPKFLRELDDSRGFNPLLSAGPRQLESMPLSDFTDFTDFTRLMFDYRLSSIMIL